MTFEDLFTSFVRATIGESIEELLPRAPELPKNADYFLFNRAVIAELKCLQKDYFSDHGVNEKLTKLLNVWVRDGTLRPETFASGRFSTDALPKRCTMQVIDVFAKPLREAVTDANKQIKETRSYFNTPGAKGLLILANDGNYSLTPELTVHILAGLFRNRFSAIDSFIYFAPEMETCIPHVVEAARIWISGPVRDPQMGVPNDLLAQIKDQWVQFSQMRTETNAQTIRVSDNALLGQARFVRREGEQ